MILDLFMELISGLYKMLIDTIFSPFKEALNLFTSTPEKLAELQFIDIIFEKLRIVGFAIFILIIGWQVFKVFFAYLGFECEEPLKIAGKGLIFGILIYYSKDLIYIILGVFKNIVDLVWQAWGTGNAADSYTALTGIIDNFTFNSTGALTIIQMIMSLYMIYKYSIFETGRNYTEIRLTQDTPIFAIEDSYILSSDETSLLIESLDDTRRYQYSEIQCQIDDSSGYSVTSGIKKPIQAGEVIAYPLPPGGDYNGQPINCSVEIKMWLNEKDKWISVNPYQFLRLLSASRMPSSSGSGQGGSQQ